MSPPVTSLIPHRPPFLFVDEIVSETENGLVARRTWRAEEDFYKGHYPGAPITPGVLLCEAVFQTGALLLARGRKDPPSGTGVPLLVKIGSVRFRSTVVPGETVTIEVRREEALGGFIRMSGSVKSGERPVATLDFTVAWKEPSPRA